MNYGYHPQTIREPCCDRSDRRRRDHGRWHRTTGTAKEKPQKGKVLSVGPGDRDEDGKYIQMDVKAGDTVLFAKYAGTEIKVDGKKVLILRESDLLAIVLE